MSNRSIEGILLIDKPQGWTSHDVCNFVRKRFKIPKVGHTGTLDPQATGVLVLLLGRFTKLSASFTSFEKEYTGTIEIGITTTSHDGDGEVITQKDWQHITEDEIQKVCEGFHGPQKQIPPMVSALRSGGVRLYALARKGKEVVREPRDINIKSISCDKIYLPCFDFTISASKGTYIRTIAHDIGEKLQTGAYLKRLCRVRNGRYHVDDCIHVETLKGLKDRDDILKYVMKIMPEEVRKNMKRGDVIV